jgi:hypothetical protein
MAYVISRLRNQIELIGISNQTYDVHLFTLQPKWLHSVYEYVLGVMLEMFITLQIQYLAHRAKPFVFQERELYRFR